MYLPYVYDRWLLLIKMYDKQNRIRGNQIPVDLLLPVLDNMMNKIYQRYWLYIRYSLYKLVYMAGRLISALTRIKARIKAC